MSELTLVKISTLLLGGIFIIALLVLWLLVRRRGHSVETAAIIQKVEEGHAKTQAKIDQARNQMGLMDTKVTSHNRSMGEWMERLMDRFGFLKPGNKRIDTDYREDKYRDDKHKKSGS